MIFLTVGEPLKAPPSYPERPCCGIPIGRTDSPRHLRLAEIGEILAVKQVGCKGRETDTGIQRGYFADLWEGKVRIKESGIFCSLRIPVWTYVGPYKSLQCRTGNDPPGHRSVDSLNSHAFWVRAFFSDPLFLSPHQIGRAHV